MTQAAPSPQAHGPGLASQFAHLHWQGRPVRIEYTWTGVADPAAPLLVFLHEGLGSVAMWRDFPQQLCTKAGARGLVYSRPGYGRSTPRAPSEVWGPDFMHQQAHELLPLLLQTLGVDTSQQPVWLLGHSDGGSIALLYAAQFASQLAGAIVLAPHILVEELSLSSIARARDAYLQTNLRERLARFHDDPDSAFWGWNNIWLAPEFRPWSIEASLPGITCPLLAVQGLDDEYGTLEHIRGIQRRAPHTRLLELPQCGHSPHRDQPETLIQAVVDFMKAPGIRDTG